MRSEFIYRLSACVFAAHIATAAQASEYSAVRRHGEDFRESRARYLGDRRAFPGGAAADVAVTLDRLDRTSAVAWDSLGSFDAVTRAFEEMRDVRFMHIFIKPKFLRRISWLYPDDGCWARAASAELKLHELNYPMASKVFAFGNLEVKTSNSPFGSVSWWYHVAPAISFGGAVFVLDPALEAKRPLTLEEWAGAMSDKELTLSICAPGTYEPGSDCATADPKDNAHGPKDEGIYLFWEWIRLLELRRKPAQELGDHPPW